LHNPVMERSMVGNYYHVICTLVCVLSLVGWCDSQTPVKTSRMWPFCITRETLEEYKSEIPKGQEFIKDSLDESITRSRGNKQMKCLHCGVGSIQTVHINRIDANLQASDFVPDAQNSDKKALELGGKAAAIPCRRRTYIHVRHPYVYVYASDTKTRDFHMNYNYLDVSCRYADMFQFIFYPENPSLLMLTRVGNKVDYVKTEVFGLYYFDGSASGMPYPYHADWYNKFTCHFENAIHTKSVGNGDRAHLEYNDDYDNCILASKSIFTQQFRDNVRFVSNKVCKIPERARCEVDREKNKWLEREGSRWLPPLCFPCNTQDNEFTREALRRLIRRSYLAKRVHGVSMIVGTIAFGVISIHISRYLKETGGGCLLVGWWLWAHLGLVIAGKAAIYIGLAMGICQPPRVPSEVEFDIEYKRGQLIAYHKVIVVAHAIIGYVVIVLSLAAVILSTACFDIVAYT
ncbi:unnamed protein product, partial [Allacma fusca]